MRRWSGHMRRVQILIITRVPPQILETILYYNLIVICIIIMFPGEMKNNIT